MIKIIKLFARLKYLSYICIVINEGVDYREKCPSVEDYNKKRKRYELYKTKSEVQVLGNHNRNTYYFIFLRLW